MAKRRLAAIGSDSEDDGYASGGGNSSDNLDVKSEDADGPGQNDNASDVNSPQTGSFPVTLKVGNDRKRAKTTEPGEDDEDPEFNVSDEESSGLSESAYESEVAYEEVRSDEDGFVVDSDDNPTRREVGRRSKPRRKRSGADRTARHLSRVKRQHAYRATYNSDTSDDENGHLQDDLSLQEELAELREEQSPGKRIRSLRNRNPVDYSIPIPLKIGEAAAADAQAQATFAAAAALAKRKEIRRLFNVKGPFGGGDVISLFNPQKADLEALIASGGPVTTISNTNPTGNSLVADVDPVGAGDVDFSQVGGLDEYIDKLKEMVSLPLLYPEVYEKFGITPPRGVLFHGPPGTGKTLMARALAASHKEKKVTFFMRKGADLLSKWVGEAERQLKALFDEARAQQPSIIFFDEIDGLAPVRSSKQEQIHSSIVSTLLALMDGMDNRGQVVVIGATNRPDSVDPALRRPGRFDREFYFPLPNLAARQKILEIHTRQWSPAPTKSFLGEIASLTKGFGGADLRALCTEAALTAIQRQYPEIYTSGKKLIVNPDEITVRPEDFALSLEHIQPSTARSGAISGAGLPARIAPLLEPSFQSIEKRLSVLAPMTKSLSKTPHGELSYDQYQRLKNFKAARVHRPRLLVMGERGNGHEYVVGAIINKLEGVFTQVIDLLSLYGDSTTTPEAALVQLVAEARKRMPACFVVPQLEAWDDTPLAGTLWGLLRGLLPSEPLLVVGVAEAAEQSELSASTLEFFAGGGDPELLTTYTSSNVLKNSFFAPLFDFCQRNPLDCRDINEIPPKKTRELPLAPENEENNKKTSKLAPVSDEEQRLKDIRTRSQLKVKLGPLMDAFKTRYRRFRKPAVDDIALIHLFEILPPGSAAPEYIRTPDDMIQEVSTGRKYHNMDLDIVEDRLWNGYYCEPRQFLYDIERIHADSVESGDRERMHKASEMLANAQVAIDDISDPAFLQACRDLRLREAQRILNEIKNAEEEEKQNDSMEHTQDVPTAHDQLENGNAESIEKLEGEHNNEAESKPDSQILPNQNSKPIDVAVTEINPDEASPNVINVASAPTPAPESPEKNGTIDGSHEDATGTTDVAMVDNTSGEGVEEEAVEEEAVEEEEHPPFELDSKQFDAFTDNLVSAAMGKTLEDLELMNANLINIVWKHRGEWDRSAMIHELEQALVASSK